MKTLLCLGFTLLLAMPLSAGTYSWVDDSGTYNFTEDYSKVPKKHRKKVKRSDDLQQDVAPQVSPVPEGATRQSAKPGTESAAVPGGDAELYGGKSRAAWQKEMAALEAELSGIEQHMELLRKQIYDPLGPSKKQLEVLKKDYDDSRAAYDLKYKKYNELIEAVRKAGIPVEIKK